MPATVVHCSLPSCQDEATHKIASPWQDGSFYEVQTFGYCCRAHVEQVVAHIPLNPKSRHPALGTMRIYTLPRA